MISLVYKIIFARGVNSSVTMSVSLAGLGLVLLKHLIYLPEKCFKRLGFFAVSFIICFETQLTFLVHLFIEF